MTQTTLHPRQLLRSITGYCDAHDMAESRFGRQAVGDPALVRDVRNGRNLRPVTIARVQAFIAGEAVA